MQHLSQRYFVSRFPLTVAYSVVRHHALNAGLAAKRALVYGLLLCVGFAGFALLTALVTKTIASNELEIGIDITIALLIGLSLRHFHRRVLRFVDRTFLPERYLAAITLDRLQSPSTRRPTATVCRIMSR